MNARTVLLTAVAVAFVAAAPVSGYLKLGTLVGTAVRGLRWNGPVRYFVTDRDVPGVTAPDLQRAVARAFGTWGSPSGVTVQAEFVGFTPAEPFASEGMSVIGFRSRPDLERTLGATTFTLDAVTGDVLESDIFLNAAFPWSTAPAGEAQRFDVESIALHEIGHLLGLGHSALGETELMPGGGRRVIAKGAVMFPIAFPPGNARDRVLDPDDVAGVSDIYGSASRDRTVGSISGRVTLGGRGVFGAHLTAFNTTTGDLIASFALDDEGHFVIAGLSAGIYIVRAEPLDDGDIDSFFDTQSQVDVGFKPAYASRLIGVSAGSGADAGEIKVPRK
ncbi:MAG: matrixin family metalloprotease [Acidobacteriota bacterium]